VPPADRDQTRTTDRLPIRVFVSSAHTVTAIIAREGGGTIRTLHNGPVADSVDVSWNGKDSADAAIGNGRYALRVNLARPGRATGAHES